MGFGARPEEELRVISCEKKKEERVEAGWQGLEKQKDRFKHLLPQGEETQERTKGEESHWHIEKTIGKY